MKLQEARIVLNASYSLIFSVDISLKSNEIESTYGKNSNLIALS